MGISMPKYRVTTSSLKAVINPMDGGTWQVAVTQDEVLDAIKNGKFEERSWQTVSSSLDRKDHHNFHVCRIAYLVQNPSLDSDEHKIFLAVSTQRNWFNDGNHRVAAAIIREDPHIDLWIASSGEFELDSLFPGIEKL